MNDLIAFFNGASPGFQLAALVFVIYQLNELKSEVKALKDSHHEVALNVAVLDAQTKQQKGKAP